MKTIIEPFRIKVVEAIRLPSADERETILRRAGFNLFHIPADDVLIDLLTDSGTGAMSALQWAAMMRADESYAGSPSFFRFETRLPRSPASTTSCRRTRAARASESCSSWSAAAARSCPNNAHFDTTRANIEHSAARRRSICRSPRRPIRGTGIRFKGNMDIAGSMRCSSASARASIPIVMCTVTSNSQRRPAGQPREPARDPGICDDIACRFFLDACRFAENA